MSAWDEFENRALREENAKLRLAISDLKLRLGKLEGMDRARAEAVQGRLDTVIRYAQLFMFETKVKDAGFYNWVLMKLGGPPFSPLNERRLK